jgi:hypothetical protein
MTDTRFCVRLDELGETVRRLSSLEEHLGQASRQVHGVTWMADCRAGDATPGVEEFGRHWKHGIANLHHTVHQLHTALSGAHEGYSHHEQALSAAMQGRA